MNNVNSILALYKTLEANLGKSECKASFVRPILSYAKVLVSGILRNVKELKAISLERRGILGWLSGHAKAMKKKAIIERLCSQFYSWFSSCQNSVIWG